VKIVPTDRIQRKEPRKIGAKMKKQENEPRPKNVSNNQCYKKIKNRDYRAIKPCLRCVYIVKG
jgi:hypothetical protein